MNANQIMYQAWWQYDAQAAMHRIAMTNDWSELRDLSDEQLAWCRTLATPDSRLPAEIDKVLEDRHGPTA